MYFIKNIRKKSTLKNITNRDNTFTLKTWSKN